MSEREKEAAGSQSADSREMTETSGVMGGNKAKALHVLQ